MTCDRCGPSVRARYVIWTHNGGILYMCGHCYNKHEATLIMRAYRTTDLDQVDAVMHNGRLER